MHSVQTYFPPVETHVIHSERVNQTFQIQVMQPALVTGKTEQFPVVYATDGNLTFDMFKGIAQLLQSERALRFALVGIGYPGDSPAAGAVLRAQDLTFPGYPRLEIPESGRPTQEGAPDFYGAGRFQKFLAAELIPFIDSKYATIPGDRAYFGHSLGGGFGLYTLFTESALFKRYIISSPGLIFHGECSEGIRYENHDFVLQEARKFIASGKSLSSTRLYMSVGAEEEFEPELETWQLTSSFYRLARLMRAAALPGLELAIEVFPGETHMTAWPIAFMHGVQAVFGVGAWANCR